MEGGDPQLPSASPSDGAAAVDFDGGLPEHLLYGGDSSFLEAPTPPLSRWRSPPPAAFISADVTIAATAATTPAANTSWCVQTGSASTSSVDLRLLEEPLPDDTDWFEVASPSPNSLQASPPPAVFSADATSTPTATTPAANASWRIQTGGTSPASVRERLSQALYYIRETGDMLVHLWEPVKLSRGPFLMSCRPFRLDHHTNSLIRMMSCRQPFRLDHRANSLIRKAANFMSRTFPWGLRPEWPHQVFDSRLPEWSPDFRSEKTKRYAQLPVFERGSYSCLGVIELIATRQKLDFTSELNTICSALQAVNLRTTEFSSIPRIKVAPPLPNSLQASPPPAVFFSADATSTPTATTPAANASSWIQTGGTSPASVRERLSQALSYIRETQRDGDVLLQLWVPVKGDDGRLALTTSGQPSTLDNRSGRLIWFKEVSSKFQILLDIMPGVSPDPVGVAFISRLPDWRQDVGNLTDSTTGRGHAHSRAVFGTLGLPVFERGSYSCLGVIELTVVRQKLDFTSELNTICSALQAVNLRSTEVSSIPRKKFSSASYKDAFQEMLKVLRTACLTHKLPLAQTWVTCAQLGKRGSRCSDVNYRYCISTIDEACYVNGAQMQGFHEACSKHHLLRGQGVAGKAFTTNKLCFLPDIGSSIKLDYPLSHHAKIFKLKGAAAIRLRCTRTGNTDFVLEFFLPTDCEALEEQKALLDSWSGTMRSVCQILRVVTDEEMEEEAMLEMNELISFTAQGKNKVEESSFGDKSTDCRGEASWTSLAETSQQEPGLAAFGGQVPSLAGVQTTAEGSKAKARTEVEKTVSLEDLQQNMEACVDKDTEPENEIFGTMSQEDEQEEEVAGEASSQQQQQSVIAKAGGQRQQGKRPRSVASTSLNPPKSRRSKVWKDFKIVSPEGADVVEAECLLCHKKLKANSKKDGTSSLWRHVKFHRSNGTEVSNGFSKSEKNNDGPIALRNCENDVALAASQARVAAGKSTEAAAKATAAAHAAAVCASASSTGLGGAYSTASCEKLAREVEAANVAASELARKSENATAILAHKALNAALAAQGTFQLHQRAKQLNTCAQNAIEELGRVATHLSDLGKEPINEDELKCNIQMLAKFAQSATDMWTGKLRVISSPPKVDQDDERELWALVSGSRLHSSLCLHG